MTYHFFTLLHGTDPGAMRVDHSVLNFTSNHEAHKFALLAAFTAVKAGAAKVEIDVRRRLAGPNIINVVNEG